MSNGFVTMSCKSWAQVVQEGVPAENEVNSGERLRPLRTFLSSEHGEGEPVESIIPGLPDDLALLCLAKISHGYHGMLQAVCKRWHFLVQTSEYARAQYQERRCGDWLFVNTEEPKEGNWTAYDPEAGKWHVLPPMPGVTADHRHYGFACVGVANRLLVMGGYYTPFDPPMQPVKYFATNEVWQFDPFSKHWSKVASMRTCRCSFACAVIGGKVYVAGGCSSSRRRPLACAEVYDPLEDRWEDIAPLPNARDDCVGVALGDLFYVIAGIIENHADQRTVEVYDPSRMAWYSLPDVWLFSRQMPCPVTSMQGSMYALDDWDANTIKVYEPQVGAWVSVGPVPGVEVPGQDRRPKGFNFGLTGLRDELYVLGGKVLRWQPANGHWKKFDILRLNTVIACNPAVKGREVSWRKMKPMGESRGAVLGCAVLEEDHVS
ncbi:hypothetical protein R1flu_020603 [Riccia fluitans]|uniref:F-box domain-containing protein n=1 Tax=Riccia fluitans TaxID=41844 RepID=A0ABD1ZNH1_9MARC